MATRFAGDFFGIPLVANEEKSSVLLDYYPELKSIKSKTNGQTEPEADEGARMYGGAQAAPTFAGFKGFEANDRERKAAPIFTGFKTFEQNK
jgi:hypothetical protein